MEKSKIPATGRPIARVVEVLTIDPCNPLWGQKKWLSHLLPREINVEAELMQALAELDEDENPDDDDAIEIPSKGKYKG